MGQIVHKMKTGIQYFHFRIFSSTYVTSKNTSAEAVSDIFDGEYVCSSVYNKQFVNN
jgi:hypothetical protein